MAVLFRSELLWSNRLLIRSTSTTHLPGPAWYDLCILRLVYSHPPCPVGGTGGAGEVPGPPPQVSAVCAPPVSPHPAGGRRHVYGQQNGRQSVSLRPCVTFCFTLSYCFTMSYIYTLDKVQL